MKNPTEMTREELQAQLNLNGAHSEDHDAMSTTDLLLLVSFGYKDASWSNDECASFISPCGHYQVFFGRDHIDSIAVNHITDEGGIKLMAISGGTTTTMSTNSMMLTLSSVELHRAERG